MYFEDEIELFILYFKFDLIFVCLREIEDAYSFV